jgi:hypothetical protein
MSSFVKVGSLTAYRSARVVSRRSIGGGCRSRLIEPRGDGPPFEQVRDMILAAFGASLLAAQNADPEIALRLG